MNAAVVDAVARVLDGARAEDVVPATLASLPHLDNAGRRDVARAIYGVCVMRLRLAYVAGVAAVGTHASVLLDAYEASSEPPSWPVDRRERIVVERSCPRRLVDVLCDDLGDDGADAFLTACNVPGPAVLRTNRLKTTRAALAERLCEAGIATHAGRLSARALVVDGHANLYGSQAWRDGWFEVQDESSQLCADACAVRPGDVVVDLCAGRGGKALALAAAMENRGTLHVHDVDDRALADMTPRLKRAGVTCVVPGLPAPATADVVLVDAPCTSTGTLRRSPDLRWHLDVDAALAALVPVQRSLLRVGARLLRRGGRLVYATCSVLRAENDDVVAAADVAPSSMTTTRLLPHIDGCDGFFIAVVMR